MFTANSISNNSNDNKNDNSYNKNDDSTNGSINGYIKACVTNKSWYQFQKNSMLSKSLLPNLCPRIAGLNFFNSHLNHRSNTMTIDCYEGITC